MEYENPENGIFQEYSKNKTQQRNFIFFGIWNIPGILKIKGNNDM